MSAAVAALLRRTPPPLYPYRRRPTPFRHLQPRFSKPLSQIIYLFASSSSSSSPPKFQGGEYGGPSPWRDPVRDWVSGNDELVRTLPIYVGGISLIGVLLNRALSGIPPVADASSSQSRADILSLALAVTCLLNGLLWLSIKQRPIFPVAPSGVECRLVSPLPNYAVNEMLWAWESLSAVTCCKSLVIVNRNDCLLQIGIAAECLTESGIAVHVDVKKLLEGSLYRGVVDSKKQNYLANLSLYPGKSELPFLPSNTQCVLLQPLGESGIMIVGGDTIRGFTNTDQD